MDSYMLQCQNTISVLRRKCPTLPHVSRIVDTDTNLKRTRPTAPIRIVHGFIPKATSDDTNPREQCSVVVK